MTFKLYKDRHREWRWTLYAKNGKKIADSSEGYKRHGYALKMIHKIILGSQSAMIAE